MTLLSMVLQVFTNHPIGSAVVGVIVLILLGWGFTEFFYRIEGRLHDFIMWLTIGTIISFIVFLIIRTMLMVPEVA